MYDAPRPAARRAVCCALAVACVGAAAIRCAEFRESDVGLTAVASAAPVLLEPLMAMELRDHRDRPFDFMTALLHTIGYSLSMTVTIIQVVSVVLICTTARRQSLTDMALGTVPVNRRLSR